MLRAKHTARTCNSCLHLVGDEQHVVLMTEVEAFLQVAVVGNEDARLALYGLSDKGANLVAIFVECLA